MIFNEDTSDFIKS